MPLIRLRLMLIYVQRREGCKGVQTVNKVIILLT